MIVLDAEAMQLAVGNDVVGGIETVRAHGIAEAVYR